MACNGGMVIAYGGMVFFSIQHALDNPRQQKALTIFDAAILKELPSARSQDPFGIVVAHFHTCLEGFKKSLLPTIEVGRCYAIAGQEGQDPANVGYEPEQEELHKWMLTGRY
jgi:hypothetical protein